MNRGENSATHGAKCRKTGVCGETKIGTGFALYIDIRTKVHKISKQKERKRKNEEEGD